MSACSFTDYWLALAISHSGKASGHLLFSVQFLECVPCLDSAQDTSSKVGLHTIGAFNYNESSVEQEGKLKCKNVAKIHTVEDDTLTHTLTMHKGEKLDNYLGKKKTQHAHFFTSVQII